MKDKHNEVELERGYSIPAPENALNIYGSPSKHAKVKILEHDKKHDGEIVISGYDAAKDKKEKAEIKIHDNKSMDLPEGDMANWEGKIEIRYNSDIVRAAIKRFANKIGLFDRFTILSWQEKKD